MAANWRGPNSALPHIYRSSVAPTGLRPLDLADWIEHEPDRFEEQIMMKVSHSSQRVELLVHISTLKLTGMKYTQDVL